MLTKRRPLRVNGPFGPLTVTGTPPLHQLDSSLPHNPDPCSPSSLSLCLHFPKSFPFLPLFSSTLPRGAVPRSQSLPSLLRPPCHSAGFSITILLRPPFRRLPLLSSSTMPHRTTTYFL